jgi:hypothetical protein
MLAWNRLADAAAAGLIVLSVGSLAARLCRQPVRRARIVVLTLLGGAAVPWLSALPFAPHWSAGLLPAPVLLAPGADEEAPTDARSGLRQPDALVSRATLETTEPVEEPPRGAAEPKPALVASEPAKPSPDWRWAVPCAPTALLGCYFAMSAGLAAWWFVGQLMVWRVARGARPVPSAVRDIFDGLAGSRGRRVILLENDRIAQPFTYTWLRPVIVLPSTLCDGDETGALRYVLAHELSHVEARDAWAWNLACMAGLVLFYQPLFWWLRRQLRLCQDYLADARAAALGSAEDYAAFLVRLARVRRSGAILPALGIGDRRSNLYRRVIMLVQDHEPLERRCRAAWSLTVASAAAVVIVAASGLHLSAAAPPGAEFPARGVQAGKNDAEPPSDTDKPTDTLHYKGTVVDKDTDKPIAGATVVVRRGILRDPRPPLRVLQETKHTTGEDGTYAFEIAPDQYASPSAYIELDVEHPDYTPRYGFGYALSMIRKNEKLNERPFFERIEMRPAKPISGRIETPEGMPATGVVVMAYFAGQIGHGSWARTETDAQGRFRLPITTPGQGAYLLLPKDYVPELYLVPDGKRGDIGTTTLKKGVSVAGCVLDVQGKPIKGVFVEIKGQRGSVPVLEADNPMFLSNAIRRVAETDSDGRFTSDPLPSGEYKVAPSESNFDGDRDRKKQSTHRQLPEVFASTKLTIKEGEIPAPLEIRALPSAVIEGRWIDSKGQPKGGTNLIGGKLAGSSWITDAYCDLQGRFSAKVPHGLQEASLTAMTNEHTAIRHRIGKDGPLVESTVVMLGTLDHHVKDIEIVRYVAPIIVINATAKDGRQIEDFKAAVEYTGAGPVNYKGVSLVGGGKKKDAIQDEQYDGRYRTRCMLPDKEVKVIVSADGYTEASRTLTLPEGKTEEVTFVLEPK